MPCMTARDDRRHAVKIGFTGTRKGLTEKQRRVLTSQLRYALQSKNMPLSFLHGGCIGADEQAAMIAGNLGYDLIEFPSDLAYMRTRLVSHETRSVKAPLARNDDIIEECDRLYACPKEMYEPNPGRGQGTWTTIRHARKANRRTIIIWPNGMIETTCEGGTQ